MSPIRAINVHEAKTHLSRILADVEKGEEVVIARAGRPVAKVVPIDADERRAGGRFGFLAGEVRVPEDFDTMLQDEIIAMFEGDAGDGTP